MLRVFIIASVLISFALAQTTKFVNEYISHIPVPVSLAAKHFTNYGQITNHTLQDDKVKVEINTNTSSLYFGTILSIQMKYDGGILSENLIGTNMSLQQQNW